MWIIKQFKSVDNKIVKEVNLNRIIFVDQFVISEENGQKRRDWDKLCFFGGQDHTQWGQRCHVPVLEDQAW